MASTTRWRDGTDADDAGRAGAGRDSPRSSIEGAQQGVYEVNMKAPIGGDREHGYGAEGAVQHESRGYWTCWRSTHADMQRALTKLNPGSLVLSFNAGIMHQKIVDMVTKANQRA